MSSAKETISREIRVFLSSTFRDMEAERDYLMKQVFPKVRAACQARQVGFTEIDLRWGITEEESKNGATVEICLAEIDRCRDFPPFFIGFLGERYGWIPKHDELAAYWERHTDSPYREPILDAVNRGISVTELEMELAVLKGEATASKLQGRALFFLRNRSLTDLLYTQDTGKQPDTSDSRYYDPADGRLDALKHRIRQSPFLGIDSYSTVEQFGQAVEDYLLQQLDTWFPADAVPSAFEQGNQSHANFRYHRLANFLPRPDVRQQVIEALKKHIETPALGPILLTGPSGQGKSALMADLARYLEQHHPEYKVIDHYIGADGGTSLDGWIHRILQTLHPIIQDISGDLPDNPKDQAEALNTWLAMAANRQQVKYVLVLDALDQLSDKGLDLALLKSEIIGASAVVICSAADGTPAMDSAKDYEHILVPPLTDDLRAQLVSDTLARYRKNLPRELTHKLAQAPQSGSPLYLTLAVEELRLDARHETLNTLLDDILKQPDAEALFLNHFLLDEDYGRPELPTLAAAFMALIGASRNGLTEIELADLLALPTDPIAEDTGKPRLPQVYLSNLISNFQPYLLNKQGNRAAMHRIFGEVALNHYGTIKPRLHLYHYSRPGYGKSFDDGAFNPRQAAEALYQITQLAKTNTKYQKQLKTDLQNLSMVARLQEVSDTQTGRQDNLEQVLFDAFNVLTFEDKTAISETWPKQVQLDTEQHLDDQGWTVGNFASWIHDRIGHAKAAKALQEKVLEVSCRILGEEHPDTLLEMDNLAASLSDLGDITGARVLREKVLGARRRGLVEEHPSTLSAMFNLANSLSDLGDLEGAKALREKVLEARRRILGEEHPDTLNAMTNLAHSFRDTGDLQGAKALQEKVLAANRRVLGDEHPDTLSAMGNLAISLNQLGDLKGAKVLQEKVLAANRRVLGDEHPDTLNAMGNLANFLGDLGDYNGAKALQEKVHQTFRRIFDDEHPNTIMAMGDLANSLRALGDLTGAKELQEKVLAMRQRILGKGHKDTLAVKNNLALLLGDLGDIKGAQALQETVLEARRRILGEEHPDTLSAMGNLAISLGNLGDLDGAKALEEKVLDARRRILGEEHSDTLSAMANLADSFGYLGHFQKAVALWEKVLEMRRHILGEEHPETLIAMSNLALSFTCMGNSQDARILWKQVLEARRKIFGEEHPDTLSVMVNLANSFDNLGDFQKAKVLQEKVLEVRSRLLGEEHPDTMEACGRLAHTLAKHDRPSAILLLRHYLSLSGIGEEDRRVLRYNLACYECLEGNLDVAKELIKIQLESHPDFIEHALADDDLVGIRLFIENLQNSETREH